METGVSVARTLNNLSVAKVAKTLAPGMYADGGGLYLQVAKNGSRSWIFRYAVGGRERYMGLGSLEAISLADARKAAQECRRQRVAGTDPIEHRQSERTEARLAAARAMTFAQCAETYIASHEVAWRNPKHRAQWRSTLKAYVYPVFGQLPVQSVDVSLIVRALEPIWNSKPETASRVRGRIECVLNWATTSGFREGDNPARWRGHLSNLFPAKGKVRPVKHHSALPYEDMPEFMVALGAQKGNAACAMKFLILTAARTVEAVRARWEEINFQKNTWTVPGSRMKGGREHRVPLSMAAVELLANMDETRDGEFIFSATRGDTPLSDMALLECLRRMGRGKTITSHGFRSTFRMWAAERTLMPREVPEAALAHVAGDKVEAAYQRSDLFEKRRVLMNAWASYCETAPAETVVNLFSQASAATG